MVLKKFARFLFFLLIMITLGFIFLQYIQKPNLEEGPRPTGLHPVVQAKRDELISLSAAKGINIVITEDFRSIADQDALFAKGRTAGGNIVTHAKGGESYHNFGLAIDFALLSLDGRVIWDMQYDGNGNRKADWMEVVAIAKNLGFEWGGDWENFKDNPHFEMDFGLTIWELQRGKRPPESVE